MGKQIPDIGQPKLNGMPISKAIELNTESEKSLRDHKFTDHADAIKLGIEALKFYQESSHFACGCLLPGQTGETEE